MSEGSQAAHRTSNSNSETLDTEAYEIGIEMSSGEPLQFSEKTVKEHIIAAEYALVCRDPIDGLYAVPSFADSSEWFGLLFIRRGVYVGAVLRFTMRLPTDFPSTSKLPKVIFDLEICHPHIDGKTRELDLRRYFSSGWQPEKHHIYHVLMIVQRTFFTFDADISSCVNPEAAAMLRDNKEAFKAKARDVIKKSRSIIYDPLPTSDPNAIRLSPWDASVHEPLRQRLIGGLTDSQISTMSMLGSLGYGPNGSSIFESRGKAGFSWVSPSEVSYMVEQPRPLELELREMGYCEEGTLDSASSCHSSLREEDKQGVGDGEKHRNYAKAHFKQGSGESSSRNDSIESDVNSAQGNEDSEASYRSITSETLMRGRRLQDSMYGNGRSDTDNEGSLQERIEKGASNLELGYLGETSI